MRLGPFSYLLKSMKSSGIVYSTCDTSSSLIWKVVEAFEAFFFKVAIWGICVWFSGNGVENYKEIEVERLAAGMTWKFF